MSAVTSPAEVTLPDSLYDTYKQSKAGTTAFLTWLVEEAESSGHRFAPNAVSQQAKGPRLKGKARRLQKEAAAATAVERYTLVTDGILPLAKKLVSRCKTKVQIPQAILHLIQKVIKARQRCTAWYEKQSTKNHSLRQSNETHIYFTNVLIGTLEILKSRTDTDTDMNTNREVKWQRRKLDDHHNNNIFGYLELEEIGLQVSAENGECKDTIPPKKPAPSKDAKTRVYEPELSENVGFAVFCMLEDLERLRLYIRRSWERYQFKEISIMNVSVCTNTALEFARQIEVDFSQRFPEFADWTAVLQYLYPEPDWLGDLKKIFMGKVFKPELVPDTCPALHSLYFFPFLELVLYTEFGHGVPQLDDIYDPRSGASGLERSEEWRRDHILIDQFLAAFPPLLTSGLVTTDEITEGLREVTRTRNVRLWAVFGLQIQLDIHHILGLDATRGLQELHTTAKRIKEMVAAHLYFHNEMEGNVHEEELGKINLIRDLLDRHILNDVLVYDRLNAFGPSAPTLLHSSKPFLLLSMHPLLCGLLQFAFLLTTQQLGLIVALDHGAITAAAHLCNAARQEKMISACWQELEELIAVWTPEKIYIGPSPTDPEAYNRRYLLIEGVSADSFAVNRRGAFCNTSKKGRRDPFKITPLLDALYWRFCQLETHKKVTAEKLEVLLNTKECSPSLRQNVSRNQKLTPVQLLTLLEGAFTEDERIIKIDYMGIHKKCMDMLRRLEEALREPFMCFLDLHASRKSTEKLDCAPNASLHGLPTFLFPLYGNALSEVPVFPEFKMWLSISHKIIQNFIEEEEAIRKKQRKEAAPVDEAVEHVPELSAATLWGILEPGHPTINGECIHFGVCKRQVPDDRPEFQQDPPAQQTVE